MKLILLLKASRAYFCVFFRMWASIVSNFFPSCNIKLTEQGRVVGRARLSRDLANGPGIGGATQCMPPTFYFWTL